MGCECLASVVCCASLTRPSEVQGGEVGLAVGRVQVGAFVKHLKRNAGVGCHEARSEEVDVAKAVVG